MSNPSPAVALTSDPKKDADYVFYELTRSICPECRRVVDAHILIRDNKVYMRKRCPDHGLFEGLGLRRRRSLYEFLEVQQAGHDSGGVRHRGEGRLPARLRALPGPPAARLSGNHRSKQRMRHGLPTLLRRGRPRLQPDARRSRRHSRPLHHAPRAILRWCSSPAASRPFIR